MPRRGENIFKRNDKRWEGRYIKDRAENGRAVYGSVYAKTYSDVKAKLQKAKLAQHSETKESVSLRELAESWLEKKQINVKKSTLSCYRRIIDKYILSAFDSYDVKDIDNECVVQFTCNLISSGLANKTVRDILTVLKALLIAGNRRIDVQFPKLNVKEQPVLTRESQRALENYIFNNMNERNAGILLCLYTGLRLGEICALTWKDIDLDSNSIKISKTLQRIKSNSDNGAKTEVIIDSPKSKTSIRIIPITDFLSEVLKKLKKTNDDEYFLSGNKRYVDLRTYQYHFTRITHKLKLENIKFHSLRHTFATRCVELGFETKSLSEILGHSDIKITLQRYVHSSEELKRKNIDKLEQLTVINGQNYGHKDPQAV